MPPKVSIFLPPLLTKFKSQHTRPPKVKTPKYISSILWILESGIKIKKDTQVSFFILIPDGGLGVIAQSDYENEQN